VSAGYYYSATDSQLLQEFSRFTKWQSCEGAKPRPLDPSQKAGGSRGTHTTCLDCYHKVWSTLQV